MAGGKNSWLVPVLAGVAVGWFFSGTLSRVLDPIGSRFGITGGHVGYANTNAYPAAASTYSHPPSQPTYERRSFDRSYDSWLHNTVNSIPTQG
jgi:hypothetical protein